MNFRPIENHVTPDRVMHYLRAGLLHQSTAPGTYVRLKPAGRIHETRDGWNIPIRMWNGAALPRITDATVWQFYVAE